MREVTDEMIDVAARLLGHRSPHSREDVRRALEAARALEDVLPHLKTERERRKVNPWVIMVNDLPWVMTTYGPYGVGRIPDRRATPAVDSAKTRKENWDNISHTHTHSRTGDL